MCKLGCGPQHREFRKEILQAMRVGVGRRNIFCENIISVPLPMQLSTSYVWRILDI
ncbi:nitrogen fixation protein NifR [Staphylococcus aureus]|nr:nitrogen fixation protein NifR [Staphylococcus aureus]PZI22024.1 nitrogen fixation protein NifR [Staphylococcus aureus]PZJ88004.1 nitrogen fixation protein NifR [Staphylococcus aureus]QFJ90643.1 nitrogen fixation protein NifR [Staphylococcus aureus]QKK90998.1 nitrogen fixation protein NifR [Staphylococcus aureus]